MQRAEQTFAPADSGACGVYAVVPVIIDISVALALARGSGVAKEVPQGCKKIPEGWNEPLTLDVCAPPWADSINEAEALDPRLCHHNIISGRWKSIGGEKL